MQITYFLTASKVFDFYQVVRFSILTRCVMSKYFFIRARGCDVRAKHFCQVRRVLFIVIVIIVIIIIIVLYLFF